MRESAITIEQQNIMRVGIVILKTIKSIEKECETLGKRPHYRNWLRRFWRLQLLGICNST